MPRKQTSIQITEATEQQVKLLRHYGTFTDIVRIAIDRMYREEKREMDKELMESVYSLRRYRVTVKSRESESEPPAFTPAMMRMVTDWDENGDVIEIDAYDCIETHLDRSDGVIEWTDITEEQESTDE